MSGRSQVRMQLGSPIVTASCSSYEHRDSGCAKKSATVKMKRNKNHSENSDRWLKQMLRRIEQTPIPGISGLREEQVKSVTSLALNTGLHLEDVMLLTWEDMLLEGHIDIHDGDIGPVLVGISDSVAHHLSAGLQPAAPSKRVFPALEPGDREHILYLMETTNCIERYLNKRFRLLRLGFRSPEAHLAIECMKRGIQEWRSSRGWTNQ